MVLRMKKNMGTLDRVIRIVLAVVFVALGLFVFGSTSVISIVLYVLAAVFLVTSAAAVCPLYMPFKINTGSK